MEPLNAESPSAPRGAEALKRRPSYSEESEGRDDLTARVIGAAVAVHQVLGPGMLESAYQACICEELRHRQLRFESELSLPIHYRERKLEERYRMDLVVEASLVVELKSVDRLAQVHIAQLLTYLRLGKYERGLLINFNVARLTDGIRRVSLRRR